MTEVSCLKFNLDRRNLLRARAAAYRFRPHFHSTYSIVAMKKGAAIVTSARWASTVRAGDVFFFNPFEVHAASSIGAPAEYETLYVPEAVIANGVGSHLGCGAADIGTDVISNTREALDLIETLSEHAAEPTAIDAALQKVLRTCSILPAPLAAGHRSLARRACRLIGEIATGPVRTHDLAATLGVHESHLIRAFKSATGLTPQTYIRQVRVAKAADLICGGMPLSMVAQTVGFCDQAHLTREFRKVFGAPPGVLSREVPLSNIARDVPPGPAPGKRQISFNTRPTE